MHNDCELLEGGTSGAGEHVGAVLRKLDEMRTETRTYDVAGFNDR
jgi:hypothetical protein